MITLNPGETKRIDAALEPTAESIPGDYLVAAADTEKTHPGGYSGVKMKAIRVGRGGAYRISFDAKVSIEGFSVCQIFQNLKTKVGTLHEIKHADYRTYSEDIGGFLAEDRVDLIAGIARDSTLYIRNFRIFSGNPAEGVGYDILVD